MTTCYSGLVAIVEDGSTPAVQLNMQRTPVVLPCGSDAVLEFTVRTRGGVLVDLSLGSPVFTWSVRDTPLSPPILSLVGTIASPGMSGVVRVALTGAQTAQLGAPSRTRVVFHDALLARASTTLLVVPPLPIYVLPSTP